MKTLLLADVYPYINGSNVVLRTSGGTVLKMNARDFLALADEIRRKVAQ